jgi:hypothetical protein
VGTTVSSLKEKIRFVWLLREIAVSESLVLFLINTITYYLRYLSPPCYARFGRALICHEKARTRSSLLNKSERSWNDAPINIRYHILLWREPR